VNSLCNTVHSLIYSDVDVVILYIFVFLVLN